MFFTLIKHLISTARFGSLFSCTTLRKWWLWTSLQMSWSHPESPLYPKGHLWPMPLCCQLQILTHLLLCLSTQILSIVKLCHVTLPYEVWLYSKITSILPPEFSPFSANIPLTIQQDTSFHPIHNFWWSVVQACTLVYLVLALSYLF